VNVPTPIDPSNRYSGLDQKIYTAPSGRLIAYLGRRILPDPASLPQTGLYQVADGERVDQIAWKAFGDATQSWRLADGNGAMRPDELGGTAGRRLRVTLPYGLNGINALGGLNGLTGTAG
jgi:hypothetical protein